MRRAKAALCLPLLALSACAGGRGAGGQASSAAMIAASDPAAKPSSSAAPASAAAAASRAATSAPAPAAPAPAPAALAVPMAVVVENAPDARPQSGLDQAAVVWEILAEGFITRFLAIFTQPSAQIGPVRSARIYFDQLVRAYGLPYAHAGGNSDALDWIGTWHLQNLDQIYGSSAYFWRSSNRQAPHNLYTSTDLLERAAADRRLSAPPVVYPATGALPAGATPTAGVRLMYYNDPEVYTYIAGWQWQGGAWVRTVNGAVQTMTDGSQVRAGTVIVLVAPVAPDPNAPETQGALLVLWDKGSQAWVLRDGARVETSWRMGRDGLPEVASPAGGGPYWYEVVPTAADVSFQ